MESLPVELIYRIIDYLAPRDIAILQLVSKRLLNIARDNRLWRERCYRSSFTYHNGCFSNVSIPKTAGANEVAGTIPAPDQNTEPVVRTAAQWDPSYEEEDTNWYAEYVARHAPMSFQWLEEPLAPINECDESDDDDDEDRSLYCGTLEVKGMGLYKDRSYGYSDKVVGPLDDGSVCIWDLNKSIYRRDRMSRGRVSALSRAGLLSSDSSSGELQGSGGDANLHFIGAGDCVSIDSTRQRAYIAVGTNLKEIDLNTLQVIESRKYPWSIFALSQEVADYDAPLTVATTLSLNIYDSRCPTSDAGGNRAFHTSDPSSTATSKSRLCAPLPPDNGCSALLFQPGPLSVTHTPLPDTNSIILAGRFPSILLYDRRFFPRLQGAAYSGARLCSSTALPASPWRYIPGNREWSGYYTVVACGEYNGRGSLEIFALSAMSQSDYSSSGVPASLEKQSVFQNRQSASCSKLLSVASHGTRIVYSDADGNIKWVERDARTPVRTWNINTQPIFLRRGVDTADLDPFHGTTEHRVFIRRRNYEEGTDVVRKILPTGEELENDEVLVWTGDRIGRLRFSPVPDQDRHEGDRRRRQADSELARREREFAVAMEQSLRAHTYQLNWMSRFGFEH
ncbi:hypothetical protein VTO42DRAFT_7448 [Malbranchea cinnamomea]